MKLNSKLERYGSIFLLAAGREGPDTIEHEDGILVRYMDRVYLPAKPSQLEDRAVVELSELRLLLGPELIDSRYTQQVLAKLYKRATSGHGGMRVLDFGCGDGNIVALLLTLPKEKRPLEVVGVDVAPFAVGLAQERLSSTGLGTAVEVSGAEEMRIESGYFDAAVANFVIHFPISARQANDIYRLLRPGGKFVYNNYLYRRDPGHDEEVANLFRRVGFAVRRSNEVFCRIAPQRKTELIEQRIMECLKPL